MNFQKLSLIAAAFALGACGSVAESIPTVKIEKRKPKAQVETVAYTPAITGDFADAAKLCENERMRARAIDGDDNNDIARVMVIQDGQAASELLSETTVNCRDYFTRKSAYPETARIIPATTQTLTRPRGYTYIVQRGDTVWDIAREHCTTVKAITRLNGLGRGNKIDIGDRLELPTKTCD